MAFPLEVELSKQEQTLAAGRLSKKQINRAGTILASESDSKSEAYAIVEQWRALHSYPARVIQRVLARNARSVNRFALTSGRLKRMESIKLKLRRKQHMDLIRMNDIAGCRAVLWNVSEVPKLLARLRNIFAEDGPFKPRYYDYIQNPKPDGYRGVHIAVQYYSTKPSQADWSGMRIEMQIRSTLQHAWATAVETVDLFANEQLKIGQGSKDWTRFFVLAGAMFAEREDSPPVPGTPDSIAQLTDELRLLWIGLKVPYLLSGWVTAMTHISSHVEGVNYLLTLDSEKKEVKITPFGPAFLGEAISAYASAEEEERKNMSLDSVLVSVDRVADLQTAFPNYYADTADFLKVLREALNDYSDLE
jgi:ppGpp synthetase/RelA/SpoT-type nucleotidyltranferase